MNWTVEGGGSPVGPGRGAEAVKEDEALVDRVEESYSCTQVLGFSQSCEWYGGLSLADYREEGEFPDPPPLEAGAFLPTWQGRFFMGGAVERWTDPRFPGWAGPHALVREGPAHCAREEVDRVVFNVSGAARSADAWAEPWTRWPSSYGRSSRPSDRS